MTSLNDKLTRVETNIEGMKKEFGYSAETLIEVVTARAIAGPQAEECMRIYDLLQYPNTPNEEDYNEKDIQKVAELMYFYLPEEEEE
jgi:hypothetical protein